MKDLRSPPGLVSSLSLSRRNEWTLGEGKTTHPAAIVEMTEGAEPASAQ